MMTTGGLSGKEIPERLPKKNKKKKSKLFFNRLVESMGTGNWDWYNEPSQIGEKWDSFYGILKAARKKNKVKLGKGEKKSPGFFHKLNNK